MRKWLTSLLILIISIPALMVFAQDAPNPSLEITGANASDLPTLTITTNVLDRTNLPVEGLTIEDFTLGGELAENTRIVSVENVTTDNLSFASVLVIDTSTSMSGFPLQQAKEAAALFVQSIGEDAPVAIATFNTRVRLVQDYTTDTALLLDVIDSLGVSGRTALYDAAVFGVDVAANAPIPRRAMILLSDGAEFGGESTNPREAGLAQAQQRGVSVYTVGLGFGTDRTYLEELATGTNARNYESPTPEELSAIYAELADLFRSQYVLTLESNIPADGTTYEFTLQANTLEGVTNVDTGTIRAPIPVPIVNLDENLFAVPFSSPVTISPQILADDPIESIEVTIDGELIPTADDGSFTLDPLDYPPADYTLTVTATDSDDESGSDSVTFATAALAPEFTVNFDSETAISEPTTITLDTDGQTPAISATYSIIGEDVSQLFDPNTDVENGFPLTIDPFDYPVGAYELFIGVENEGGATANISVPFSIASVPPQNVRIEGISSTAPLEEPTSFSINADTQAGAEIAETVVTLGTDETPLSELRLNPASLQPGLTDLIVTVTDSNGATITETLTVEIASLPPLITLGDVEEPLTENTSISVQVDSQTPLLSVTYHFGDDIPITLTPRADGTYPDIPLNVEAFGDGELTIVVEAVNSGGASNSITRTFEVQLPPTATPTPNLALTADAQATNEANVLATGDAQATVDAEAQAEANAQATNDAQATVDAEAQAESNAQATNDAQATSDAEAEAEANAQATKNDTATSEAAVNNKDQDAPNANAKRTAVG
ncbi:MAG: vWA domain-containing protein, partial [Anaerolineae bacterium]